MTHVEASARGIYRCLADNTVAPAAVFDVTLHVYFAPQARAVQSSYGQAENRMFDITLECIIGGKLVCVTDRRTDGQTDRQTEMFNLVL